MKRPTRLIAASFLGAYIVFAIGIGTASLVTAKHNLDYEEAQKADKLVPNDSTAVIYDGIFFANKQEMKKYIGDAAFANASKWFTWTDKIPLFAVIILGACSFSLLGSVMKILYEHIYSVRKLYDSNFIAFPLLGFLSGFLSTGISYLLPKIFIESEAVINPVGLILFSLLFGFFHKEFIDFFIKKIFTNSK